MSGAFAPKSLLKNPVIQGLASGSIASYIRLVRITTSWQIIGREHLAALEENKDQGFILAFWHSRLLMVPTVRQETNRKVYMLVSLHRDGEIIVNGVKPFGIEFIRGSGANVKKKNKDKSGAPALTQMIAALKEGSIVGMTPDGPRGPRQKAQPGTVRLSIMANAPILPMAYATSRGSALGTWDRFWLAAPFSKGAFAAGAPLYPPQENTPETIAQYRHDLEAALNRVMLTAEQAVGRLPEIGQTG